MSNRATNAGGAIATDSIVPEHCGRQLDSQPPRALGPTARSRRRALRHGVGDFPRVQKKSLRARGCAL